MTTPIPRERVTEQLELVPPRLQLCVNRIVQLTRDVLLAQEHWRAADLVTLLVSALPVLIESLEVVTHLSGAERKQALLLGVRVALREMPLVSAANAQALDALLDGPLSTMIDLLCSAAKGQYDINRRVSALKRLFARCCARAQH